MIFPFDCREFFIFGEHRCCVTVACHAKFSISFFVICLNPSPQTYPSLIYFGLSELFCYYYYYNSGISLYDLIVLTHILGGFCFSPSQSKREVDRRLEELRDHYERGHAETERKLRRELKKTKALLRDAQAVIETQVSCRPHSIPLSHHSWCVF